VVRVTKQDWSAKLIKNIINKEIGRICKKKVSSYEKNYNKEKEKVGRYYRSVFAVCFRVEILVNKGAFFSCEEPN